jgi:hypothetical protein
MQQLSFFLTLELANWRAVQVYVLLGRMLNIGHHFPFCRRIAAQFIGDDKLTIP